MVSKQRFFNILYVALILSLIAFMIWLVVFLKGSAKECLKNPIQYIENRVGEDTYCYCMKEGKLIEFREGTGSYLKTDDLDS